MTQSPDARGRSLIMAAALVATALIGLLSGGQPAGASYDGDAPVLVSIGHDASSVVGVGGLVTFGWSVADASDIANVGVVLADSAGAMHQKWGSGATGEVVFAVDHRWAPGPVSVTNVQLEDVAGNVASYRGDGSMWCYPEGASCPESVPLDHLDFVVDNPAYDGDAPVLVSIGHDASSVVGVGGSVTFGWSVADASDIASVVMVLTDSAGATHSMWGSGANGELVFAVDQSFAPGSVSVRSVQPGSTDLARWARLRGGRSVVGAAGR